MPADLSELLGTWRLDPARLPEEQSFASESWLEIREDRVGFLGFDTVSRRERWYPLDPAALDWTLGRLKLIDSDFFGDEVYVTLIRAWAGLGEDFSLKVAGYDALPWGDTFPVIRDAKEPTQ